MFFYLTILYLNVTFILNRKLSILILNLICYHKMELLESRFPNDTQMSNMRYPQLPFFLIINFIS
jgi:hypothetical protein